ncbi:hypothetical protein TWF696_003529 [Orbilia brochopaga]|uniref:methylated diphthine methylhydrolase n=1 Tax=Orbilia brochopaga TaxID=3140254 RepID=A0AAV9U0E2_9PEZI
MSRAASSIYTAFLEAPPAACISVPFDSSSLGSNKNRSETSSGVAADADVDGDADVGAGAGSKVGSNLGGGGSAGRPRDLRTLLVTGTYTLDKETSLRHGSLLLHEAVLPRADQPVPGLAAQLFVRSCTVASLSLSLSLSKLHHSVPLASGSVLDIRLLSASGNLSFPSGSSFVVCSSTGQILVYAIAADPTPLLYSVSSHSVTDESTLVLSLALCPTDNLLVAATTSKSTLLLLRFEDNSFRSLKVVAEIDDAHHSLEAWTTTFSADGRSLYSGGDDASFAAWDIGHALLLGPDSANDPAIEAPLLIPLRYRSRKAHTAGVTAILSLTIAGTEYIFTGSYDQYVRVYLPAANKWLEVAFDLGGGVWRLEKVPDRLIGDRLHDREHVGSEYGAAWVLASCMHAGCQLLRATFLTDSDGERVDIRLVKSMTEHDSMNYASACVGPFDSSQRNPMFLSTSFYDKRVCCWSI